MPEAHDKTALVSYFIRGRTTAFGLAVKIDAIEQLMRKTLGAFPSSRIREGLAKVWPESTRGSKSVHARRRFDDGMSNDESAGTRR